MFWQPASQPLTINQILQQDEISLEDIINHEDILTELKNYNSKLIEYLTGNHNLAKKLLDIMLKESACQSNQLLSYKLPFVVSEIFDIDAQPMLSWFFPEQCGNSNEMLDYLMSFLQNAQKEQQPLLQPPLDQSKHNDEENNIIQKTLSNNDGGGVGSNSSSSSQSETDYSELPFQLTKSIDITQQGSNSEQLTAQIIMNETTCGYFFKVCNFLILKKPMEMSNYIFSSEEHVQALLRNLDKKSISDVVLMLISIDCSKSEGKSGQILQSKLNLLEAMASRFEYNCFDEMQNIAEIISEIIQKYYIISNGKEMLDKIMGEEVLNIFFKFATVGQQDQIVCSYQVLTTIAQYFAYNSSLFSGDQEENGQSDFYKSLKNKYEETPFIRLLLTNLDFVSKNLRVTSIQGGQPQEGASKLKGIKLKTGIVRMKALDLIEPLFQMNIDAVQNKIIELQLLNTLVELVLMFQWNSILHIKVFRILQNLLTQKKKQRFSSNYIEYFFKTSDVLNLILDYLDIQITDDNAQIDKKQLSQYRQAGNFGIITKICNCINEIKNEPYYFNQFKDCIEGNKRWQLFSQGILSQINAINLQDLGDLKTLQNQVIYTQQAQQQQQQQASYPFSENLRNIESYSNKQEFSLLVENNQPQQIQQIEANSGSETEASSCKLDQQQLQLPPSSSINEASNDMTNSLKEQQQLQLQQIDQVKANQNLMFSQKITNTNDANRDMEDMAICFQEIVDDITEFQNLQQSKIQSQNEPAVTQPVEQITVSQDQEEMLEKAKEDEQNLIKKNEMSFDSEKTEQQLQQDDLQQKSNTSNDSIDFSTGTIDSQILDEQDSSKYNCQEDKEQLKQSNDKEQLLISPNVIQKITVDDLGKLKEDLDKIVPDFIESLSKEYFKKKKRSNNAEEEDAKIENWEEPQTKELAEQDKFIQGCEINVDECRANQEPATEMQKVQQHIMNTSTQNPSSAFETVNADLSDQQDVNNSKHQPDEFPKQEEKEEEIMQKQKQNQIQNTDSLSEDIESNDQQLQKKMESPEQSDIDYIINRANIYNSFDQNEQKEDQFKNTQETKFQVSDAIIIESDQEKTNNKQEKEITIESTNQLSQILDETNNQQITHISVNKIKLDQFPSTQYTQLDNQSKLSPVLMLKQTNLNEQISNQESSIKQISVDKQISDFKDNPINLTEQNQSERSSSKKIIQTIKVRKVQLPTESPEVLSLQQQQLPIQQQYLQQQQLTQPKIAMTAPALIENNTNSTNLSEQVQNQSTSQEKSLIKISIKTSELFSRFEKTLMEFEKKIKRSTDLANLNTPAQQLVQTPQQAQAQAPPLAQPQAPQLSQEQVPPLSQVQALPLSQVQAPPLSQVQAVQAQAPPQVQAQVQDPPQVQALDKSENFKTDQFQLINAANTQSIQLQKGSDKELESAKKFEVPSCTIKANFPQFIDFNDETCQNSMDFISPQKNIAMNQVSDNRNNTINNNNNDLIYTSPRISILDNPSFKVKIEKQHISSISNSEIQQKQLYGFISPLEQKNSSNVFSKNMLSDNKNEIVQQKIIKYRQQTKENQAIIEEKTASLTACQSIFQPIQINQNQQISHPQQQQQVMQSQKQEQQSEQSMLTLINQVAEQLQNANQDDKSEIQSEQSQSDNKGSEFQFSSPNPKPFLDSNYLNKNANTYASGQLPLIPQFNAQSTVSADAQSRLSFSHLDIIKIKKEDSQNHNPIDISQFDHDNFKKISNIQSVTSYRGPCYFESQDIVKQQQKIQSPIISQIQSPTQAPLIQIPQSQNYGQLQGKGLSFNYSQPNLLQNNLYNTQSDKQRNAVLQLGVTQQQSLQSQSIENRKQIEDILSEARDFQRKAIINSLSSDSSSIINPNNNPSFTNPNCENSEYSNISSRRINTTESMDSNNYLSPLSKRLDVFKSQDFSQNQMINQILGKRLSKEGIQSQSSSSLNCLLSPQLISKTNNIDGEYKTTIGGTSSKLSWKNNRNDGIVTKSEVLQNYLSVNNDALNKIVSPHQHGQKTLNDDNNVSKLQQENIQTQEREMKNSNCNFLDNLTQVQGKKIKFTWKKSDQSVLSSQQQTANMQQQTHQLQNNYFTQQSSMQVHNVQQHKLEQKENNNPLTYNNQNDGQINLIVPSYNQNNIAKKFRKPIFEQKRDIPSLQFNTQQSQCQKLLQNH